MFSLTRGGVCGRSTPQRCWMRSHRLKPRCESPTALLELIDELGWVLPDEELDVALLTSLAAIADEATRPRRRRSRRIGPTDAGAPRRWRVSARRSSGCLPRHRPPRGQTAATTMPEPFSTQAFWDAMATELPGYRIADYVRQGLPPLFACLHVAGVTVDRRGHPGHQPPRRQAPRRAALGPARGAVHRPGPLVRSASTGRGRRAGVRRTPHPRAARAELAGGGGAAGRPRAGAPRQAGPRRRDDDDRPGPDAARPAVPRRATRRSLRRCGPIDALPVPAATGSPTPVGLFVSPYAAGSLTASIALS